MAIRDVVFRDIKTTTVTQMRDVHIRDKIIKDCILLGSPLTVGMFSSRIVSCLHPQGLGIRLLYCAAFASESFGWALNKASFQIRTLSIHK